VRARSVIVAIVLACNADRGPALQIVGESTRVKLEAPVPRSTAWFDGNRVELVAARGEVLGIQVLQRAPATAVLTVPGPGVTVRGFEVESFAVRRPSTAMYGGSQGAGTYADALREVAAPATNPAYFEIAIDRGAAPGPRTGELRVGDRVIPIDLAISTVTLPPLPIGVWAYEDPREVLWAADPKGDPSSALQPAARSKASAPELACIEMFREHGVLLSPNVVLDWWADRKPLLAEIRDLPVVIPRDPATAGAAVKQWIAATAGTGQVPFAIPIDEPRTKDKQQQVIELSRVVRDAGGGPTTFRYAVTDIPREDYGDRIDLYISLYPRHADGGSQWTYNGAPPHAGAMVLDAATPGTRTWGWIAWRWKIPTWYVWDALYWHDRHNRKGAPLPGTPLVPHADPVSFDDGEDHGNFDGVLALPATGGGCTRTLRLAALRRGLQDKQLLELAAACDAARTAKLAAEIVPRALGDAPKRSARSWSADESTWERGRRRLLELADCRR
jgi:hypothetical protein